MHQLKTITYKYSSGGKLMKKIIIEGNHLLEGNIKISGAKNSAVALIPAALLSDGVVTIDNIPNISDIHALEEILIYLKATVKREKEQIIIDASHIENQLIPEEISSKLRASYYFMSALLGKYKKAEMYFPGGCNIGARPIDQTLKAYKALGATVIEEENHYIISAEKLIGAHVYLDMPSVGATINTILVATKATGTTIIENAAKEPEIVNIATLLNNMGAKITGAGTSEIKIQGVDKLNGAFIEVMPDRIEAGTYIILGALIGNKLKVENIIPEHLEALTLKLKEMGVELEIGNDYTIVSKTENLKPIKIKTLGYPGFATDLQQPLTPLLTQCQGISEIEETIYENRYGHVKNLNKLGADIEIKNNKIYIKGPTKLLGNTVESTDLRAGAAMILAALVADKTTTIEKVEHILRGYENIIEKLENVGAKIKLEEI